MARVNGVDLYFQEQGVGAPVLGVHGSPSSALLWVDAAGELAKHGRSIIYDRRGFFRSGPFEPVNSLDLTQHVDDAVALLAALHAVPAVVIGRSTGGQIALEIARRFPDKVKGLVLLEPAIFTIDPRANNWAADLRRRLLRRAAEDPSAVAEELLRDVLGDDAWGSLPGNLQGMFADTSPALLAEMSGRGLDLSAEPATWTEAELEEIRCPVLIVSAEDSLEACRLVNARLAAMLPSAASALVQGGHLINPAHPAVLSFIDRLSSEVELPPPP